MTDRRGSLTPRRRVVLAVLLGLCGGAAVVMGPGGCVDTEEQTVAACPPIEDFRAVSAVLEQRCGTLDCHGDGARPFKVYGRVGLRGPLAPDSEVDADQYFSGGAEQTTDIEIELNYRSLCGLEPEIMSEVTSQARPAGDLTLVRKPRLQERHKGGRVWDDGDPGDRCLVRWLEGNYAPGAFDPVNCRTELGL